MEIKKIGVLTWSDFPEGWAPTTRIIAYCKGLVCNGVSCEVVIFRPKLEGRGNPISGTIDGITYQYSHWRKDDRNAWCKILIDRPLALLKAVRLLYQSHRVRKYDYVFLTFDSILVLAFFVPILRLLCIKLAFVGDEYPYPIRIKLHDCLPWLRMLAFKIIFAGIQVRILMTEALEEFFNNVSPKPTHILPVITDLQRFDGIEAAPSEKKYLCYMGNLELQKDNVDNIIEAFNLIKDQHKDLVLYLFGLPSSGDRNILESLIKKHGLESRVFLKGRVNYSEVPLYLSRAHILLTSQPDTKRAEGGFPTKLGEYLMSLKPVIVTDVGEIHCYIQDGVNAYMVAPSDPVAYADKINYILENYQSALDVARAGQDFVIQKFGCENVSRDLKSFLDRELTDKQLKAVDRGKK